MCRLRLVSENIIRYEEDQELERKREQVEGRMDRAICLKEPSMKVPDYALLCPGYPTSFAFAQSGYR
jgi:hypothetical protein